MTGLWFGCLLMAAVLLAPSLAMGQRIPPRIWVGPLSVNTEASSASMVSAKLDEVLRQELKKPESYTYVGRGNILLKVKAGATDPRIETAENMRTAGKSFHEAGQHEKAKAALLGALERYQIGLPSLKRLESLLDTLVFLAAVDWALGRRKAARKWILRAAAMWPEAEIEGLPKPVAKRLARAQRKALASRRGVLAIKTDPTGAMVRVNGVEVGKSPVRVPHMANGRHYVQASHPEAGMAGEVVRVRKNRGKTKLTLRKALGPPEAKTPGQDTLAVLWKWKPGARRIKRRVKRKFRKAMKQAGLVTHCNYLLLPRIADSADGKTQVLEMRLVEVKKKKVHDLEPIPLPAAISNIFVTAVTARKSLEKALESRL